MADGSIHSLTSTLASTMSDPSQHQHVQPSQTNGAEPVGVQSVPQPLGDANAPPAQLVAPPPPINATLIMNPDGTTSEAPIKRKPGRPKGSGKKQLDPNAEPKIKRPVGRPRKDGLPAGSVGPRRASRPRKRPPGTFASGQSASAVFPYATTFEPSFINSTKPQWRASMPPVPSISARTGGRPGQLAFSIDPTLDRDNWSELARSRPDVFLQTLVTALVAPNPVSAGGPTVEEAFRSHLVSLAPGSKQTPSIPSLYSVLKTFWLPSSPVYFSITASASQARTPSDYRFLYWDPQPLVFNGIACPACSVALTNRGRISSGPIKVYDLGKPFFIIGCEYVCTSPMCVAATTPDGRKFASTDMSIFRALPPMLKNEFPALLLQGNPDLGSGPEVWNWQGLGVSIALWNMVRASLKAGLRKESILDIIRAIQVGVPEDDAVMGDVSQVQALAGEEEEEEEETQDAAQVEGDLEYVKDKSNEEYNEAWNANSGVANAAAPQEPQAGPSNSSETENQPVPAPQQQPSNPPPAPAPAPQFPFAPAPYPGYYPAFAYYHPHVSPGAHEGAPPPQNHLKRTFSIVDSSPDSALAEPMTKRIRHCCKCGSNECKGKGGRAFCTNPCQDCGKLECKGRNSKRPDRTCADAWP